MFMWFLAGFTPLYSIVRGTGKSYIVAFLTTVWGQACVGHVYIPCCWECELKDVSAFSQS